MRSWLAGIAVLMVAVLGACGPSDAEKRTSVDAAWRTTVDAADEVVRQLVASFPDVEFVPFVEDPAETRKSDCSSSSAGSATNPTAIQWASQRDVRVEPARETVSLVDGLGAALAVDGWEPSSAPAAAEPVYRVEMSRDGYSLTLLTRTAIRADGTATIRVLAYSPCLQAPENMGDWTPPTDAPTGEPSGGAVAPTPSAPGSTS